MTPTRLRSHRLIINLQRYTDHELSCDAVMRLLDTVYSSSYGCYQHILNQLCAD